MLRGHDAFHVFQHHDGVVHHDADGKHHGEERQRIDGIAESIEARERADNGYGNGHAGNDGGAPALQKDVHHDEHQNHGLHQGGENFVDGFEHEVVGVHKDGVVKAVGHGLADFGQLVQHAVACGDGVGAGQQIDRPHARHHAVIAGGNAVVLAAQLYAGHVLEAQHGAVRATAHDDLAEFLRRDQAALGIDLPGKLRGIGRGHFAKTPWGVLGVLLLNGRRHFIDRHAILCQLVRLQPDAHGIVHAAENDDVANARNALERVHHVNLGPVVDVDLIVAAIGRKIREHQQHGR